MRKPVYMSQFKRDIKRLQKSGFNMELMKEVAMLLLTEASLPTKLKDHSLKGS